MKKGCRVIYSGNATAIICGGVDTDHECDEKIIIYEFSDGFRGTLFDKARKEKVTLNMCDDDKLYFLMKKGFEIRSASVACSKCGRAEIDNVNYLP